MPSVLPDPRFGAEYLDRAICCLREVDPTGIERIAKRLLDAYERGAQVFVVGNGGSASLASHFACDLAKGALGKSCTEATKRFRVISLADNMALITAWANDVSYDEVFAQQLRGLARPGDVLVVITASGNSPNILCALEAAQGLGVETIGWLGFDGGKALGLVDDYALVAVRDYGLAESVHGLIGHLITSWLAAAIASGVSRIRAVAVPGGQDSRPRPQLRGKRAVGGASTGSSGYRRRAASSEGSARRGGTGTSPPERSRRANLAIAQATARAGR